MLISHMHATRRDSLGNAITRENNTSFHNMIQVWPRIGAKYRVAWQNESKISTMSQQNSGASLAESGFAYLERKTNQLHSRRGGVSELLNLVNLSPVSATTREWQTTGIYYSMITTGCSAAGTRAASPRLRFVEYNTGSIHMQTDRQTAIQYCRTYNFRCNFNFSDFGRETRHLNLNYT